MNLYLGLFASLLFLGGVVDASPRRDAETISHAPIASCAADSNYQRLSFWVGDWDVVDSTGAHYATQRVHAELDSCAIIAEWTGTHGDRGINLSAFDRRTGDWRQVYVSNQIPAPTGVSLRRSDPTYDGPGIRFIPLAATPTDSARSRVTIMPMSDHRVLQLFEDSRDAGTTWRPIFRAIHRPER